jgi:hypothetical protein
MGFIFVPSVRVQQPGEKGRGRIGSGNADRDLACLEIGDRVDRYRVPEQHHGGLSTRGSQPVEPDGVVARLLGAEQRLEWRVVLNEPDHAAVLVGIVVEKIRGRDAARARHVAHDHGRVAWNVPAHVADDRARECVIPARRIRAHHHGDGFAFVEIDDRIGLRRRQARARDDAERQ